MSYFLDAGPQRPVLRAGAEPDRRRLRDRVHLHRGAQLRARLDRAARRLPGRGPAAHHRVLAGLLVGIVGAALVGRADQRPAGAPPGRPQPGHRGHPDARGRHRAAHRAHPADRQQGAAPWARRGAPTSSTSGHRAARPAGCSPPASPWSPSPASGSSSPAPASGIGMRAAAADGPTASLMGIRLSRTGATGWALAGVLAALAGIFLTSFPAPGVAPTVALRRFLAIPAWVLGGFDSVPGAVRRRPVIGLVTSLTIGYESDLAFLGTRLRRGRALRRHDHRPARAAPGSARQQGGRPCLTSRRAAQPRRPARWWRSRCRWSWRTSGCSRAVRDGHRHRRGRADPAGRRRRPAVPRPRGLRGHRRLRLRLGDRRSPRRRSPAPGCLRSSGSCWPSGRPRSSGSCSRPVASRLRGIYLGLATLGLVFIVRHLLLNLDRLDRRVHRPLGGAVRARRLQLQQQETRTTSPSPAWSSRGCTGSGTSFLVLTCWPAGWPATCAPAAPGAPGRTSATARPRRRPWASPSPGTRPRRSSSPRATPGWPGRSSRWPTAGSPPTSSASPCRSTSW